MPGMTDEEADALDELVTKNPPKVSGNGKNGFFMKHKGNMEKLQSLRGSLGKDAFGSPDGVEYQRKVRSEWDD